MLQFLVFVTFVVALIIGLLLEVASRYTSKQVNTNPQFLQFQHSYFLVYYVVIFGDWLNAPYVYKLYTSYGFLEEQIAIIYVCGYASSLIIGTISGLIAKKYGCRRVFVAATFAYAVSCLMKLSADYSTLIVARILSGVTTSLLFTAQEIWYIDMHIAKHDFPPEWIKYSVDSASKGSAVLAICAGCISYFMTEFNGLGPAAPSVLSSVVLVISCAIAFVKWNDNFEKNLPDNVMQRNKPAAAGAPKERKIFKECLQGLRTVVQNPEFLQIGLIQALFESVLCLFVFLWTPVLDHHAPPLGIVFASFMAGSLAAGALHRVLKTSVKTASSPQFLCVVLLTATGAVLFCVFSTEPTREFPILSFIAFFVFETISGIYFPAMRDLKHEIELDKADFALTTWFRIPLNLLACFGLLFLHSSSNITGTRNLFVCCAVLIAVAAGISGKFIYSFKRKQTALLDEGASL